MYVKLSKIKNTSKHEKLKIERGLKRKKNKSIRWFPISPRTCSQVPFTRYSHARYQDQRLSRTLEIEKKKSAGIIKALGLCTLKDYSLRFGVRMSS